MSECGIACGFKPFLCESALFRSNGEASKSIQLINLRNSETSKWTLATGRLLQATQTRVTFNQSLSIFFLPLPSLPTCDPKSPNIKKVMLQREYSS